MPNIKIELTMEEAEALNGLLAYEIETQGSLSKEIKSIYKKLNMNYEEEEKAKRCGNRVCVCTGCKLRSLHCDSCDDCDKISMYVTNCHKKPKESRC